MTAAPSVDLVAAAEALVAGRVARGLPPTVVDAAAIATVAAALAAIEPARRRPRAVKG